MDGEAVDAALLELEDEIHWDPPAMLDRAVELERRSRVLGDDLLVTRARLCQANLHMRAGDLPGAARQLWEVHRWATRHGQRRLLARTHVVFATLHRHLGDVAECLDHAVRCVELLDDSATDHMRIWHHAKLADALCLTGSMEAARQRYRQAADLAIERDRPGLLLAVLNNFAYSEYVSGHHELARQVAERLCAHAAEYGFELDASSLDTIGAIQAGTGHYAEAERTLLDCLRRHRDGGRDDADSLAEYLLTLARAQRGLGALDRAQRSLDDSRRLCGERGLGHVLVRLHQEQAELHAARGDFAAAYAVHKVFFTAYHRQRSVLREAQARTRQVMFETAEARREAARFREQARRDPLTGLRNRRYVDERLPGLIDSDPQLSLAIVDVDHFKRINDRLSHDVGDQVLAQVAGLLEAELTAACPDGFVARMGGEEFLAVLPATAAGTATRLLDGIRRTVGGHDWAGLTGGLPVTLSIGVAGACDADVPGQAALLSIADHNLYAAKHGGRDRVVRARPDRAPAA
jgi:diguanylate cyclase (GGDEF)-like protein